MSIIDQYGTKANGQAGGNRNRESNVNPNRHVPAPDHVGTQDFPAKTNTKSHSGVGNGIPGIVQRTSIPDVFPMYFPESRPRYLIDDQGIIVLDPASKRKENESRTHTAFIHNQSSKTETGSPSFLMTDCADVKAPVSILEPMPRNTQRSGQHARGRIRELHLHIRQQFNPIFNLCFRAAYRVLFRLRDGSFKSIRAEHAITIRPEASSAITIPAQASGRNPALRTVRFPLIKPSLNHKINVPFLLTGSAVETDWPTRCR